MYEITITLHTSVGDVVTSYPASMGSDALECITLYTLSGKNFSVATVRKSEQINDMVR